MWSRAVTETVRVGAWNGDVGKACVVRGSGAHVFVAESTRYLAVLKHLSCSRRSVKMVQPPASMSLSARRLRQEPFDERPAWKLHLPGHLRTASRTLHFFVIGEKSSNAPSAERGAEADVVETQ